MTHLAGRRILSRIDAEDLVQEVYLRALASPEKVPAGESGEASLRRYLNALARHAVIDAARAIRAAKRDGKELPLTRNDWSRFGARESGIQAHTPGPATRVQEQEEAARLQQAFESLSAEHRRVLGLRQLEGLSARDAARRMGRSETAVHSLYRRALQAWELAAQKNPGDGDESERASRPEGS